MKMKIVRLKNGTEEPMPIVATTMMALESLLTSNPIAFYELVQVCRDPTHRPFGNTGDVLKGLALFSDAGVHQSVRNIVLAAVTGEDFDMHLGNPSAGRPI